jgi:hypothetical protein
VQLMGMKNNTHIRVVHPHTGAAWRVGILLKGLEARGRVIGGTGGGND